MFPKTKQRSFEKESKFKAFVGFLYKKKNKIKNIKIEPQTMMNRNHQSLMINNSLFSLSFCFPGFLLSLNSNYLFYLFDEILNKTILFLILLGVSFFWSFCFSFFRYFKLLYYLERNKRKWKISKKIKSWIRTRIFCKFSGIFF